MHPCAAPSSLLDHHPFGACSMPALPPNAICMRDAVGGPRTLGTWLRVSLFSQPFYEQVVSAVGGVLQVQLPSIMPLGCIVETNYHSMLIFKCLWPLGVYALLYLSSKFLNMRGNEAKADACIDLAFFLMVGAESTTNHVPG